MKNNNNTWLWLTILAALLLISMWIWWEFTPLTDEQDKQLREKLWHDTDNAPKPK